MVCDDVYIRRERYPKRAKTGISILSAWTDSAARTRSPSSIQNIRPRPRPRPRPPSRQTRSGWASFLPGWARRWIVGVARACSPQHHRTLPPLSPRAVCSGLQPSSAPAHPCLATAGRPTGSPPSALAVAHPSHSPAPPPRTSTNVRACPSTRAISTVSVLPRFLSALRDPSGDSPESEIEKAGKQMGI